MNSYPVGDVVRLSTTFTASGVATDPTTVTLLVKGPGTGTLTFVYGSSTMVKDSTGNYHYDYTITLQGQWFYRWVGTGTVIAAAEGQFQGGPSFF